MGALAVIDRNAGIEGEKSVVKIFPASARKLIDKPGDKFADSMKAVKPKYEDPEPVSESLLLASRQNSEKSPAMGLYLIDIESGGEIPVAKASGEKGIFDAKLVAPRPEPPAVAPQRSYGSERALMYVSNVYEGTHMKGVKKGDIKSLRVICNPPKLYWSPGYWENEGSQAPAMNYDDYDDKVILGTVPVESDGSRLLRGSLRKIPIPPSPRRKRRHGSDNAQRGLGSPGRNIVVRGRHESRNSPPPPSLQPSMALKRKPSKILPAPRGIAGAELSYMKNIQPILDRHCVKCHDFGGKGSGKIILCGDRGLVFNQSYLQLHSKRAISAIGAGADAVQEANSWGARQKPDSEDDPRGARRR